ncbi:MAG: SpoVG family protein [Actinobacteria bacterium]|nr:SpoVG family protein [Actinomycetota bacterium]
MKDLITEVKIFKPQQEGKVKAYASITLGNVFVITDFKVLEGTNGLFVAMPSKKQGEEYKDTAFPITKEARQELVDTILAEYEKK